MKLKKNNFESNKRSNCRHIFYHSHLIFTFYGLFKVLTNKMVQKILKHERRHKNTLKEKKKSN